MTSPHTLYLLRHAKAVVADGTVPDFDRPLAGRGQRESVALAALLAARTCSPGQVVCSSAVRTRETLGPLRGIWSSDVHISITRDLYDADADDLLTLVQHQDDGLRSLMLIGHNPSIEELARSLAGWGDEDALKRLRAHFPPAALAVIDFDAHAWHQVRAGVGRLTAYETPRG